jgi:TP901 family phage tail tape measure protein
VVFEGFAKGLSFAITGDITGLVKAVGQAELELAKVDKAFATGQKSIENYGASMTSMGKNLSMSVTAPILAVGTASVYVAAEFDDSMRQVQATSGATGAEFDALREQARQLGADTAFSATEAAEGMNYLAAAGFDANQVMAAMPGMLSLASAGSVELGEAASIASSILNGFGLEAEEAGRVADVLAKSAAATNAGVTDMGEAMSYVAPVARATGLSLEETAAAIGVMSNAGIQGSMAGTALRGSITALLSPTDEAADIMGRYNLQLNTNQKEIDASNKKFADATLKYNEMSAGLETAKEKLKAMRAAGNSSKEAIAAQTAVIDKQKKSMEAQKAEMDRLEEAAGELSSKGLVPLNEIVKQFGDSGMSTAEIMTIFGDRAGPGMLALIQNGQTGLIGLTTELENSGGSAEEMAEIMESGPGGAFRTLEGSMEDLAITFGDTLIPAIMPFIDILKDLANWLSSLDKNTLTIIVTVAAFAAAVGPVLIVLGMLISSIGTIITIAPILGAALTLLSANPIVLVIAAVALLVLGLYYLEQKFHWIEAITEAFGAGWAMLWDGMVSEVQGAANIIGGIVDWMVSGIKWGLNIIIDGINTMIGGVNYASSAGGLFGDGLNIPDIPRLAAGGTITSPGNVMVGESGPEILSLPTGATVTPLSGNGGTGVTITGNTFVIREDADIPKLARELGTYITSEMRRKA